MRFFASTSENGSLILYFKKNKFFFQFFFPEQIYTKVKSSAITEINKYKKTLQSNKKKTYKEIKQTNKKNLLPTYPVCFSQCIIKLLVKCYL